MNFLNHCEQRDVPAWCHITVSGTAVSPSSNNLWIPRDASRSLDIFWDGTWCRADYFTWDYGVVYRYEGDSLPTSGKQWRKDRYTPAIELEIKIINLAGREIEFDELERIVRRPRMEIAAIMKHHRYNGWACTIHHGLKTRLIWGAETCA
jgi:hypothetical protein